QVDAKGNVNVSKFGNKMNGCGGFIDMSPTVKTIVFSGSLVVGGQLNYSAHKVRVEQEGHISKSINEIDNIDFNVENAFALDQDVYFVTERAVFELTQQGLKLIEIAPGLDLERDILASMDFKPIIAEHLEEINNDIYQCKW